MKLPIYFVSDNHFFMDNPPNENNRRKLLFSLFEQIKKENGLTECVLIEVKPKKQLTQPKKPKRITRRYLSEVYTFGVNEAKWKAATSFCSDRKWRFKIITEDHLF